MNIKQNRKGICPVCGQAVVVKLIGLTDIVCPHKLSQHPENPLHDFLHPGNVLNYLVGPHENSGWNCKGVNCTPEKILD